VARCPYVALDTSSTEGMWDGRRGEISTVTVPPSYSEDGKAVYMGKGARCLRQRDREVGEMPTATTVVLPAVCTGVRHWSAEYSERRTSGAVRGGQKRAGNGTSLVAYSTLARHNVALFVAAQGGTG